MAVIINEFEVITQPQAPPTSAVEAKASPAGPSPDDIERIIRRQCERMTRISAH